MSGFFRLAEAAELGESVNVGATVGEAVGESAGEMKGLSGEGGVKMLSSMGAGAGVDWEKVGVGEGS